MSVAGPAACNCGDGRGREDTRAMGDLGGWVIGIVVVLGIILYAMVDAAMKREERDRRIAWAVGGLAKATNGWTAPLIMRQYASDEDGNSTLNQEATVLYEHGYRALGSSSDGGHLHAGRLILTGGLSALGGQAGIRSKGTITVTYQKEA